MKKYLTLFLTSLALLHGETHVHRVTRRVLAVAACAASAIDGEQSARYLDGHHLPLHEGNPFLRNSNGSINLARMISFKAGICAAPFVVEAVTHEPTGEDTWANAIRGMSRSVLLPTVLLGEFTFIDLWNQHKINGLRPLVP